MSDHSKDDFIKQRDALKNTINQMDKDRLSSEPKREAFFEDVYTNAENDPTLVPWADLAAKDNLLKWLADTPEHNGCAVDVGCGLGDNAEALVNAGYETVAFDFSSKAIKWAKQRFPDSLVDYREADLFDLPKEWIGKFDLVHECYTLQSIPPETLTHSVPAVASLLAPNGLLLVYSRIREDSVEVNGPPWPLEETVMLSFADHGLELLSRENFTLERPDKKIPHVFCVWRKVT